MQDEYGLFEVVLVYKCTQIVTDFFNYRGKYVYLNVRRSLSSLKSPSIPFFHVFIVILTTFKCTVQ